MSNARTNLFARRVFGFRDQIAEVDAKIKMLEDQKASLKISMSEASSKSDCINHMYARLEDFSVAALQDFAEAIMNDYPKN